MLVRALPFGALALQQIWMLWERTSTHSFLFMCKAARGLTMPETDTPTPAPVYAYSGPPLDGSWLTPQPIPAVRTVNALRKEWLRKTLEPYDLVYFSIQDVPYWKCFYPNCNRHLGDKSKAIPAEAAAKDADVEA